MAADGRFSGRAKEDEVHFRLNTMLSLGSSSADQPVFGSNPKDLHMWHRDDSDIEFAQDASISGQLARQLELRRMVQGATLKATANSKLRRLLARNKSFSCLEIPVGVSVPSISSWRKKVCQGGVARLLCWQLTKLATL